MIKPITKRERLLMKKAFDAAKEEIPIKDMRDRIVAWCAKYGNANDFFHKNKYKVK